MSTAITIKRNIAKLEAALKSKATPKSLRAKLESQLVKSKAELSGIKKGEKPKTSSAKSTQTTLDKLKAMVEKKKYSIYKGAGVDLKKDAEEGALHRGRRISKGLKGNQYSDKKSSKGHVYYEYRANRVDVKQPKKAQKYPKLEHGGYMAKGGGVKSDYKLTFMNDDGEKKYMTTSAHNKAEAMKEGKWWEKNPDYHIAQGNYKVVSVVEVEDKEEDVKDSSSYKIRNDKRRGIRKGNVTYNSDYSSYPTIFNPSGKPRYAEGGELGNWYKEGSDKWGLENTDIYIQENGDKYDVYIRDYSYKLNKWFNIKETFDTFEEAKKYGYEKSIFKKGGYMAEGGETKSYTYVPNKDIKELMVVLKGHLKKINGTDILDGVYLKGNASSDRKSSSESSSKITVDNAYNKILAKAKENDVDKEQLKNLKKEDVQKLIDAGYNMQDLYVIYIGIKSEIEFDSDNEISEVNGIFAINNDYLERNINALIKAAKEKKYELGLKYPMFNWSSIVKKYNVKNKPIIIENKRIWGDGEYYIVTYELFVGDNVVFGHEIKRARYRNDKLDYADKEGNEVKDYTKINKYQKERESQAGFNNGYWGIVSSEKSILYEITKMIASQKDGYVKDLDFFYNRLGGVGYEELDKSDIKYAQGGISEKEVVESNNEMVLSQIKAVKHHADELSHIVSSKSDIEAWVVAKIERASTDLSDITHYLDGQTKKMAMGGEMHRTQE